MFDFCPFHQRHLALSCPESFLRGVHSCSLFAEACNSSLLFSISCALFLAPKDFHEGAKNYRGVPLRARSFGPLARRRCAGIQSSQQHRGILVIHRHVFHNDKLFPVEGSSLRFASSRVKPSATSATGAASKKMPPSFASRCRTPDRKSASICRK